MMNLRNILFPVLALIFLNACKSDKVASDRSEWLSPASGLSVKLGDSLTLQIQDVNNADSIAYFADQDHIGSGLSGAKVIVGTTDYTLGVKSITARIYKNGEVVEEIGTNIVVTSALVPKKIAFSLAAVIPHDTSSYTQGLEFYQGFLYESDGEYGASSIRKVDPKTGGVLQRTDIAPNIFAEGISVLGDKILMLTYQENLLLEFDRSSLKLSRELPAQYVREGWGLCSDGEKLFNTDGSNRIYILNKESYMQESFLEVYDHEGPVYQLNELEYIDGMIYANIYTSYRVVVIDPKTGQVKAEMDLESLYPDAERSMKDADMYVLNGLAWDARSRKLYATGKKWDKMFVLNLADGL